MRIQHARLLTSAARADGFPRAGLSEIAFAGRSNVGKSRLLNALVGRKKGLARISGKPGCTRLIHFYELDHKFLFADLPGYGYAKVPEAVRLEWGPLVRSYLEQRSAIRLVCVLVDARHKPAALDLQLVEWLRHEELPFRVVLTKSDKLSGNERPKTLRRCAETLELDGDSMPLLSSAKTGLGLKEIWREIRDRVSPSPSPPPRSGGPLANRDDASPPGDPLPPRRRGSSVGPGACT